MRAYPPAITQNKTEAIVIPITAPTVVPDTPSFAEPGFPGVAGLGCIGADICT
jgi:hypothetical protein